MHYLNNKNNLSYSQQYLNDITEHVSPKELIKKTKENNEKKAKVKLLPNTEKETRFWRKKNWAISQDIKFIINLERDFYNYNEWKSLENLFKVLKKTPLQIEIDDLIEKKESLEEIYQKELDKVSG